MKRFEELLRDAMNSAAEDGDKATIRWSRKTLAARAALVEYVRERMKPEPAEDKQDEAFYAHGQYRVPRSVVPR